MDPGELTVSLNGPEHLRCSRQTFCSLSSLAFPPCPGGPTCPWCGHRDSLSCLHHHHGCLATCLQHKHTHMCYQHQVQPATQKHSMSVASLACNTKTQHVSSQSCLQHRNTACQQQLLPATQKHSMSAAGLACNTETQHVLPATQKHSMSVAGLACNTETQHVSSRSCLQHRSTACQQQIWRARMREQMGEWGWGWGWDREKGEKVKGRNRKKMNGEVSVRWWRE